MYDNSNVVYVFSFVSLWCDIVCIIKNSFHECEGDMEIVYSRKSIFTSGVGLGEYDHFR
jgi:hypothetical protein